jgi:hypothetical protein
MAGESRSGGSEGPIPVEATRQEAPTSYEETPRCRRQTLPLAAAWLTEGSGGARLGFAGRPVITLGESDKGRFSSIQNIASDLVVLIPRRPRKRRIVHDALVERSWIALLPSCSMSSFGSGCAI